MRARFITRGERSRVMIRTNSTKALCKLSESIVGLGYEEVGFVGFWVHVVLPRRKSKQENVGNGKKKP